MGKGGGESAGIPRDILEDQIGIQQGQLALSRESFGLGKSAWQPAFDYWSALLKGGQPARVAVGPFAEEIGAGYDAARGNIEQNLPRGGERNLAVATSELGEARDKARLYAGVQPQAAGQIAQLAGIPFGVSVGLNPQAQIGASAGALLGQSQQNISAFSQGAEGVGRLLYQFASGGGGGGVQPTPPTFGSSSGGKK